MREWWCIALYQAAHPQVPCRWLGWVRRLSAAHRLWRSSRRGRGHSVAFAACNDSIFVATSRNFVLRHDTSGGAGAVAELELSRSPDARVRRLFVDPLGLHALVTVQTGSTLDTFYLDSAWKKARQVAKLRNVVVTSVAWPPTLRAASLK